MLIPDVLKDLRGTVRYRRVLQRRNDDTDIQVLVASGHILISLHRLTVAADCGSRIVVIEDEQEQRSLGKHRVIACSQGVIPLFQLLFDLLDKTDCIVCENAVSTGIAVFLQRRQPLPYAV